MTEDEKALFVGMLDSLGNHIQNIKQLVEKIEVKSPASEDTHQ